ncbi:MAG: pentapeptide repeat-containing protein [Bacteroidetes bacterium]|nr:pentapeptide repeat-containing protein [Bacteroidota bacterium]
MIEKKRRVKLWLLWLIGTFIVFVVITLLICNWQELIDIFFNTGIDDQSGALLKIVLTGFGGLGIFLTFYATMKRANAAEKSAQAQAETAKAQLESSKAHREENQINRFNQAIEQLGHDDASVRMGGIYTLHGIAKESKENETKEQICSILCSYVRENSKILLEEVGDPEYGDHNENIESVTVEIQTACDVLFKDDSYTVYEKLKKNLSGAILKGVMLNKCHFINVEFGKAILNEAELNYAQFCNVSLYDARLYEAKLKGAVFADVDLSEANLANAFLEKANLAGNRIIYANLKGAILVGADLRKAVLYASLMQKAEFKDAKLDGANFKLVRLDGVKGLTYNQLASTLTLEDPSGIPAEIFDRLKKEKPELFEEKTLPIGE